MAVCPASTRDGMVEGLIGAVDCHIRVLVQDSYRQLVGPDTLFASVLTGLLTIYIALVGYQILLGRGGLRVTDLPVTVVKIGLVLAFVTSWAAYQTVVFNVMFDGPREILQALLAPMAQVGSGFDGDLYRGIERAYADMTKAATVYGGQASPTANILQGGPSLASGMLWLCGIGMLMTTVGLILAVKIVLAFLLAIGPIFIAFFLFESTRGLFDGWLRMTIAMAVTPLAVNVFGAAMLLMLQPFLTELSINIAKTEFDMGVIVTIAIIVGIFAFIMGMALRLGAGIAMGFTSQAVRAGAGAAPETTMPNDPRGPARAEAIAARLEVGPSGGEDVARGAAAAITRRAEDSAGAVASIVPPSERLGQAYRREARPRPRAPARPT